MLPEQDVPGVDHAVVVVVSKQPVAVFRPVLNFLQEVRERVRFVVTGSPAGDA